MANYFLTNFPLFCILISMTFISIRNFKIRKEMSTCFLILVGILFALSISVSLVEYAEKNGEIYLATIMTMFGYIIRPICILLFAKLADHKNKLKHFWVFYVLLSINALVYLTSIVFPVESISHFSFYYSFMEDGKTLVFNRGVFNYSSHILSALALAWLLYISIRHIRAKHLTEASVIIICSLFVVAAVVIEMVSLYHNLLNITVAIASVFYYMFLIDQLNHRDQLTDVLNRQTFYNDCKKLDKSIGGLMVIDMNGLKYINDNYGHSRGDDALKTIGKVITYDIPRTMHGYRIGGDEFIILCFRVKDKQLEAVSEIIKSKCKQKECSVSIGYAYRNNKNIPIEEIMKIADAKMYEDKANFYKENTTFDRRKRT